MSGSRLSINSAFGGDGDSLSDPLTFLSPPQMPDELGRLAHYRVLKLIGQGGMGVVLLAEDTHLQRKVALKVMRPELGQTPSSRERFIREARAMAQVRSDHVVTIFQVGQENEVCFLAMELLEGEPLDRRLARDRQLPLEEVLRIGRDIALALSAAHVRGLVHRDVKPANVWLEKSPAGRVKLLDFGLARPLAGDAAITNPKMVVGTPMYMAPEQALGESLDGRADLFSLGCLLYEMSTGRPPFEGKSAFAILSAVISTTPEPASQLNPALPTPLVVLLTRLLAKEPNDRPASAEIVAEVLRGIESALRSSGRSSFSFEVQPKPSSSSDPTPSPSTSVLLQPRPTELSSGARLRARGAERRQVTLLVGGCRLFESETYLGFEAEDQAELLRGFQRACEQTVRRFDGTVVQCDEQALLACFGYPIAREDAASRAAEAGLHLLQDLRTIVGSHPAASRLDIGAWAGLHTGPAIVEVKEDVVSLVGDVRNVAVRMKEFADTGQLVCTQASRRLFRDKFECTEIGEQRIKGQAKLLALFRVERGAVGTLSGFMSSDLTPLTGRDYEISLLKERWEQACDGMGHVVLLVGEPGLGKSRLVYTLKEHVQGREVDTPIIEWRCSPHHQNTVLHPAVDYFERVLGFRPEEPPQNRFDRMLSFVAKYGLDRPEVVPLWASLLSVPCPDRFPPPALPPARLREETFRLIVEWLHVRATRSPIFFVVEDLHWVDASSLELLTQVVAAFPHDRVLALFTCRPEFKPPWAAMDHQTSLALTRLTRRQVGELIHKKAGDAVPDELVDQVYDRAGGVPLFVEEFTKMVQESAVPERAGSTASGHEIPSSLQDLIMTRLDRTESGRDLAQLASVLGREFSHEVLATVAAVDETTLQEEMARLARADILHAKGCPPRCTYIFKHALLEDALYGSLVKSRRQEFHRRIAETLESRFPQTVETQPEVLARHFTGAGLAEKAVVYWLKAGQRSRGRSAFAEAIGHLNQGLTLVSTLPETRARDDWELQFLTALAPTFIAARGYAAPEVGQALVRAGQLCQRIGDTRQQLGILLGMWEWHIVRGDIRMCVDLADEGTALAEQSGDPGMMMEALFMLGVTLFYRGQFAEARVHFENALARYDDRERTKLWTPYTGHDGGVTHRCYLALTLWHLGDPNQAMRLAQETCELAASIAHAFSMEHAVDFAAFLAVCCRAESEALARSEVEMALAVEHAFPFWHALGTLHKGAALLLLERHEEALPLLLKGLAAFRGSGAGLRTPSYLGLIGEACTRLGRFEEAHQALDEALAVAERNDDRSHEAELHRLRGELLLAESPDKSSDAEVLFLQAIKTARQQQSRAWELRSTLSLSRLWLRAGRREDARSALSAIHASFAAGDSLPDLVEAESQLRALA